MASDLKRKADSKVETGPKKKKSSIAARVNIDPRVMMKPGISQGLVKKAVNYVLRTIISRPRSNPVQSHRRKNFKPTRSRFHPDCTPTPPLVTAKSGNEDFARETVSWFIKSRMSTSSCSNFKPIRTPIRTLRSQPVIFSGSQPVILSL